MDVGIDETRATANSIDAAEQVYGAAKEVFRWTQSLPVVSVWSGMTETVATKALHVLGTNFPEVDYHVEHTVRTLDGHVLNPVLGSVTAWLMQIGGTTERVVRPLVEWVVSSPLGGFFLKSSAQESSPYHGKEEAYDPSAENQTPEVTPCLATTNTNGTTLPSSISTDLLLAVEGTDVSSVDTAKTATSKDSASFPTAPEVVPVRCGYFLLLLIALWRLIVLCVRYSLEIILL